MALFEKFGEMNSAEELVKAAEGLLEENLEENDIESLKILAKENGFDEEDVVEWMAYGCEISITEAAIGKLKVEEQELALPEDILIHDWVDYVRKMSLEDVNIAKAVRTKEKNLADCIGKIMQRAFENQWAVPANITEKTKTSARVTFGIPSEIATRKIIREYYGG